HTNARQVAVQARNKTWSSLRPDRSAVRTNRRARQPASSSDTNARQTRDPTSSPCQQEFFRPRINEVAVAAKSKRDSLEAAPLFDCAKSRSKLFMKRGVEQPGSSSGS